MSVICDAHKKKVDVELLYNPGEDRKSVSWGSDELGIRCGRENHHPAGWAPRPPIEQPSRTGKNVIMARRAICCSSVRSLTPSHTQPFQIKWEVYFSKELCRSSLLCRRYNSARICVCSHMHMSIQHKSCSRTVVLTRLHLKRIQIRIRSLTYQ